MKARLTTTRTQTRRMRSLLPMRLGAWQDLSQGWPEWSSSSMRQELCRSYPRACLSTTPLLLKPGEPCGCFLVMTFFALVLDTTPKISNSFPSLSSEPAECPSFGTGRKSSAAHLLHSQFELQQACSRCLLDALLQPQDLVEVREATLGARLEEDDNLDRLVAFAQQKLVLTLKGVVMGVEVDFPTGKMTQSQAIALLTAAVGLDICPSSSLSELLAASHMNLVLRISKDRSRVYTGLPVEPILAEAAARTMRPDIVKEEVLRHFEEACMQGYVTPGPRGEFVAKFILLSAMWSLKGGNSWYLRRIKLDDYLKRLLVTGKGDEPTSSSLKRKRNWASFPEEACVFFNSFVTVSRPPDAAMLGRCFAGQAIMYQADNDLPGADLIIPVWTAMGMTCIVVSVKNMQRPGWLEQVATDMLKCEFTQVEVSVQLPVITVAMSLREPSASSASTECDWILWKQQEAEEGGRHIHVTCYGIENNYSSFLAPKLKEKLKSILNTRRDPLVGAANAEANAPGEV